MKKNKILFTGGHLTPAVAVIEVIQDKYPEWEIVFVGRKTLIEGNNTETEEARIATQKKICFIPISAGRFPQKLDLHIFGILKKIVSGIFQAMIICKYQKPTLIMSFGGYVALPIAIAGFLNNIPIITHEQTSSPGLANRFIAFLAKKICISYPESKSFFPSNKTILTGLPIRNNIYHPPQHPVFTTYDNRPLIYILGGASGSQSINNLIYPIVSKLIKKYWVVHQTGRIWISEAKKIRQNLRGDRRKYYLPIGYVDDLNHSWFINNANLVVSRSGANTVKELEISRTFAILIPLPWSRANEQYLNALAFSKSGLAIILNQDNLTSDKLLTEIEDNLKGNILRRPPIKKSDQSDNSAIMVVDQIISVTI
jgi:UDP-N-acetylglucosamine--N-acetylmuramyl-(pentapeptide) pyrophosphoryl-undecaprenol N-acetylglucosamine transferase